MIHVGVIFPDENDFKLLQNLEPLIIDESRVLMYFQANINGSKYSRQSYKSARSPII